MPSGTPFDALSWFEMPRAWALPWVRLLRLGNTALDAAFYDVDVLRAELRQRGIAIATDPPDAGASEGDMARAFGTLSLDALSNPEGAILVVNPQTPPYVTRFDDVVEFLAHAEGLHPAIGTASVTGVGSSALGSTAFAWNIAVALGEPVAAIVPGYGMADVMQQALGGWFGFEAYNFGVKQFAQEVLAHTAPGVAGIGRRLMKSAPGHAEADTGVPVFRRGNGSSDVLHALLQKLPGLNRLVGHSKGALVIENAINDLPPARARDLHILTFGCAIGEGGPKLAGLGQVLGRLDWLGWLNSSGNQPTQEIVAKHSTNTAIPLSMPITNLVRGAARAGLADALNPGICAT